MPPPSTNTDTSVSSSRPSRSTLDPNDQLLEAAHNGNTKKIKELIKLKADINYQGQLKDDPCIDSFEKPVKFNALMLASKNGHTAVVKLLIELKANIDSTNIKGQTAFMHAIHQGHTVIAKMLIAAKADPNAQNSDNLSALGFAIKHGIKHSIKCFADAGGDINHDVFHKENALCFAMQNRTDWIFSNLINQYCFNKDILSRALFTTVRLTKNDFTDILMQKGADPNFKENGEPLLLRIVNLTAKPDTLNILIKARPGCIKVDINIKDKKDCDALMKAVSHGKIAIVNKLLAAGAVPDDAYDMCHEMVISSNHHANNPPLREIEAILQNAIANRLYSAIMEAEAQQQGDLDVVSDVDSESFHFESTNEMTDALQSTQAASIPRNSPTHDDMTDMTDMTDMQDIIEPGDAGGEMEIIEDSPQEIFKNHGDLNPIVSQAIVNLAKQYIIDSKNLVNNNQKTFNARNAGDRLREASHDAMTDFQDNDAIDTIDSKPDLTYLIYDIR